MSWSTGLPHHIHLSSTHARQQRDKIRSCPCPAQVRARPSLLLLIRYTYIYIYIYIQSGTHNKMSTTSRTTATNTTTSPMNELTRFRLVPAAPGCRRTDCHAERKRTLPPRPHQPSHSITVTHYIIHSIYVPQNVPHFKNTRTHIEQRYEQPASRTRTELTTTRSTDLYSTDQRRLPGHAHSFITYIYTCPGARARTGRQRQRQQPQHLYSITTSPTCQNMNTHHHPTHPTPTADAHATARRRRVSQSFRLIDAIITHHPTITVRRRRCRRVRRRRRRQHNMPMYAQPASTQKNSR